MPIIEIVQSNSSRLNKGEYQLIIRKKGISFRKSNSEDPLDTLLILTLRPDQIHKTEFIEKRNGSYHIILYAQILERMGELIESKIELKSVEIPVSVLFEKLDLLFNKNEEIIDVNSEELEDDPLIYFLNSFELVFVDPVRQSIQIGLSLVKVGVSNIQKTLKKGIRSLNKFGLPLLQQKEENEEKIEIIKFKEEYISINKVLTCYIDTNSVQNKNFESIKEKDQSSDEKSKKILLLLHGIGFDYKLWRKYISKFYLDNFRILSYDLRGHGKTQRPEKLKQCRYKDIQDDLDEFIKENKLDSDSVDLTIIAFSSTGMILTHYLEKKVPKSLKKVVLLSASDHISKEFAKICRRIPTPEVWLPLKDQAKEKAKEMLFTNQQSTYINEILEKPIISDANVLTEMFRSVGDKKFEKQINHKKLKGISILAMVGSNDPIFPPESIISLKKLENVSLKVIEGGNHFFPFENDEYINYTINEIEKFIDQ
ncbi:MAG: 2-succinyl-6-hydroxy-2,4-cyclohexadiene-1-carboxylate synthase [Candidatus Heimdallarchaeota archaeon LC_3]|nr:MAG: 2-succinyl-6-hydroxy-2,4-cyclohexadiene-1-carboxylate synthase [Candidatus Heimdallarchaeota archaeon LC_3]